MRSAIPKPKRTTPAASRALRELLAFIRDHVDLPADIVAKIDAALRG
jgi:hypothetical protein